MEPYEALYGCRCRTLLCWTELGERKVLGLELVQETEGTDRKKSYTDLKQKEIKFNVDYWYLCGKKVLKFGRKDKLSLRFIGPYRILKRIGLLELPPELERIYDVFYVSMLRRYRSGPSYIIPIE
ncbi:DNA/RNA polymerases superfamily protein [Gossypium australe]|uniref:DNA/RNA polymerases superfamily protein n=1 Tax=Gossypium australe TaxID=47621 RepID=A0A5B6W0E6_9ROSI|nr:DNA/RNA polymerases superfamily protein [Gossypium australe]